MPPLATTPKSRRRQRSLTAAQPGGLPVFRTGEWNGQLRAREVCWCYTATQHAPMLKRRSPPRAINQPAGRSSNPLRCPATASASVWRNVHRIKPTNGALTERSPAEDKRRLSRPFFAARPGTGRRRIAATAVHAHRPRLPRWNTATGILRRETPCHARSRHRGRVLDSYDQVDPRTRFVPIG